ncbi:hypothetical protein ACFQRL_14165 [Microbacterium fluvii]|uniref:Transposase n=1 Tax=Microbacterium fluvii TaxID=415215 RepID=A0ABW2HFS4_9MICO|nr:hypothetical protein [Microbacterium fluvii]MCU4673735.1 hypothetical protein [Microbacterium fluvii]
MTPAQEAEVLTTFDRHMLEATGYIHEDYERIRESAATSLKRLQLWGSLIDKSGVLDKLDAWARAERKSNAGRKPHMSFRTVLILFMMHIDAGDNRYNSVARTLFAQLTPETRAYLGLPRLRGTKRMWYQRYRRSLNRILVLCEPWTVDRRKKATAAEYQAAVASYSEQKRTCMDELINDIIRATVRRLPADIRATYKGNVALDATLIEVVGRPNPGKKYANRERWNVDAMSGRYSREGTHEGTGHEADKAGWEAETVVTVPNKPGAPDTFPVLTTAMTVHQPGRTRHGGRIAMQYHAKEFTRDERHLLMTDMLYPGLTVENFQLPIAQMGYRTVWDIREPHEKDKAIHGTVDDAIAVDGCLYLKWMPELLVNATVDFRRKTTDPRKIDEDTYYARLKRRAPYRVMGKGRPEEDGTFRFYYPTIDAKKHAYVDHATGTEVKRPILKQRTLTVSPDIAEHLPIIKQLQMFELRSDDWHKWYGMRNRVEENNYWLKHDGFTDLGNPEKRRARGYAYQALTAGFAAAVSNMRRIVSFIANAAIAALGETTLRNLRRYDQHDNPIPHP